MNLTLLAGLVLLGTALALALLAALLPGMPRVPATRRRAPGVVPPSLLTRAAEGITDLIAAGLRGRGDRVGLSLMEAAGLTMRLQDYVFLSLVGALVAGTIGLLVANLLVAVLFAVIVLVLSRVLLTVLADRRRTSFADQLEESLQLLASGLRAGHSLLQAIASVAEDSESPTREEFARILNEARVGREVTTALNETAERMGSQDFTWVAQAIAINRAVGGNLADVLDGVGATIRERGQIRRQVDALAAEGKLSAVILMGLPFGVAGFLMLTNPAYLTPFFTTPLGWGLLALSVVMLVIGGLVMAKTVKVVF